MDRDEIAQLLVSMAEQLPSGHFAGETVVFFTVTSPATT